MNKKFALYLPILLLLVVFGLTKSLSAAPPPGGYLPGGTLNPDCAPGDTDCYVSQLGAQDEGVDIASNILKLNFTGSGVTATESGGIITITIPGSVGGGLTSLNGLTGTTQTFAIGSTGTSPNWSSVGTTHTLNLPTASATNSGILSSADYITFSNSVSPISLGTSGNTLYTPGLGAGQGDTVNGNNIFFGENAGDGATGASYSNFFGNIAGLGAAYASNSNFFGPAAGYNATNASSSNFFGQNAGVNATDAYNSNFFGPFAGQSATNAAGSNFFGSFAGQNAASASNSNFFGQNAGQNATNANNSIFLGTSAGFNDTVNNTSGGTSILIGDNTNTGGYSNSIALGAGAVNTSANQLYLGDSYIYLSLRGVNYELPSADGSSGQVLTTDGSGVLTWTTVSGGGGSSQWSDDASNIYFDTGSVAIGANTPNTSSILDLTSTTLGFLMPRMTELERNSITSPATGLVVYNTDDNVFNYYDGSQWTTIGGNSGSSVVVIGSSGNTLYTPGLSAGEGDTSLGYNIFLGSSAGVDASGAYSSVFMGSSSGHSATNASNSFFVGDGAGLLAANANNSNFFGQHAGFNATNAHHSNFFGSNAGYGSATSASNSNFFGQNAGQNAASASNSNFFGQNAGQNATNANNSIFLGTSAGFNDTVNNTSGGTSILIGDNTNTGGYSNSIALGAGAVNTSANQLYLGDSYIYLSLRGVNYELPSADGSSGQVLTTDGSGVLSWGTSTVALGSSGNTLYTPGLGAGEGGENNIFFGNNAGNAATNVSYSNFLGFQAGLNATNASNSLFFGAGAGQNATNAQNSNFLGVAAGYNATNASHSNFFGDNAGYGAVQAGNSNFIGLNAGQNATNANNSIFLGTSAGFNDTVNNTSGGTSILIGDNTNTGGYSNSIALGAGAVNTSANQLYLGDSYIYLSLRGVNYELPSADGGAGYVLKTDGNGVLSWDSVIPTMSEIDRGSISSPYNGQIIYNTDTNSFNFYNTTAAAWHSAAFTDVNGAMALGTSTPNTSSILDLTSTTLGFLMPRMTELERNSITSPATGLAVYNTDTNSFDYYNGSAWVPQSTVAVGSSGTTLHTPGLGAEEAGIGHNIFFGVDAGLNATNVSTSNFIGSSAGANATNAIYSNFIGSSAGFGATDAIYSNFLGVAAGVNAINASNSSFFGQNAGQNATNAIDSNFFGTNAGSGATDAGGSNFIGSGAGQGATNASHSNFFGQQTGQDAINAIYSNFLGFQAGQNATNANNSIFLGTSAGFNDTVDNSSGGTSILIGDSTSTGGFSNSIALGAGAVNTSANQLYLGDSYIYLSLRGVNYELPSADGSSGQVLTTDGSGVLSWGTIDSSPWLLDNTTTYYDSGQVAIGTDTPDASAILDLTSTTLGFLMPRMTELERNSITSPATGLAVYNTDTNSFNYNNGSDWAPLSPIILNASHSLYSANGAGHEASDSVFLGQNSGFGNVNSNNIFVGSYSGFNALSTASSNFLGFQAGFGATSASYSNFFGHNVGQGATNAVYSNFLGNNAGQEAINAGNSNFLGNNAGAGATNANNSFFFGQNAGSNATNANNSIFLGTSAGFNDTVNNTSGGTSILIGDNTNTGGYSNSIALGAGAVNTSANELMIGSASLGIEKVEIIGSSSTCTITTGTGIACSSDERLKDNIQDLDSTTLDKVLTLRTVTYNWKEGNNTQEQIGFLAQDLESQFPQLVTTNTSTGYKSVFYSQMTPVLVKAVQEVYDFVSNGFASIEKTFATWREEFVSKRLRAEDMLCVGETCVDEATLQRLLENNNSVPSGGGTTTPPVENPEGNSEEGEDEIISSEPEEVSGNEDTEDNLVEEPAASESQVSTESSNEGGESTQTESSQNEGE